jgi:branched-chain amino acid transport system ATP-binding protein
MTAVSDTPLLGLSHLVAGHAGVPVVRDLNLTVGAGEVVALLGPNGAGKTTTLLTASGLLKPLRGTVRVLGRTVAQSGSPIASKLARAGLGHVPDDRGIFANLTVRENLCVAAGKRRPDLSEIRELFPSLVELLDRRAGVLSGGEQQMLAIARALVRRPTLLMVDELSLGLAPLVVEQLMRSIRAIADRTGAGVLVVEQHVHLALRVADRAYVLNHGDLVMSGPTEDLLNDEDALHRAYLGP